MSPHWISSHGIGHLCSVGRPLLPWHLWRPSRSTEPGAPLGTGPPQLAAQAHLPECGLCGPRAGPGPGPAAWAWSPSWTRSHRPRESVRCAHSGSRDILSSNTPGRLSLSGQIQSLTRAHSHGRLGAKKDPVPQGGVRPSPPHQAWGTGHSRHRVGVPFPREVRVAMVTRAASAWDFPFGAIHSAAQPRTRPTFPPPGGSRRRSPEQPLALRVLIQGPATWTTAGRAWADHMQLKFLTGKEGASHSVWLCELSGSGSSLSSEGSPMWPLLASPAPASYAVIRVSNRSPANRTADGRTVGHNEAMARLCRACSDRNR